MTLLVNDRDLRPPDVRKTRAEELRAQLADDIVRGTLTPG
jgi:DNA-binding GntR family transcriptional regulator